MASDQGIPLPTLPVYEYTIGARPPRTISGALKVQFLLNDRLIQWAAMWLLVSLLPFWDLGMNADLSGIVFRAATVTVTGHVLTSNRNGDNSHTYAYSDLNGKSHQGVSYGWLPEGQSAVTVEYVRAFPQTSRIAGMKTGPLETMMVGMCLLPILGLLLMWASLSRGVKNLALLRGGVVGTAVLKSGTPSATRVGSYDATYEFRTTDSRSVEGRVVDCMVAGRLMNGDTVPILYNPNQPETNVPLGTISASLEIRSNGEIVLGTNGWLVFILPCLAMLAYAVGAYLRFCR